MSLFHYTATHLPNFTYVPREDHTARAVTHNPDEVSVDSLLIKYHVNGAYQPTLLEKRAGAKGDQAHMLGSPNQQAYSFEDSGF